MKMYIEAEIDIDEVLDNFDDEDILEKLDDESILDYARQISTDILTPFKSQNPGEELVFFIEAHFPEAMLITKEQVLERCKQLLENTKLI